ncbi:MAG: HAD family phosphatase [Acidobacteriaceae bacterium]|nr:HAD family phosphatase [Acidobacteriaceae bacterium]
MNPDQVAFLFDLDGVVIDSMPLHTLAWQEYLERHGIYSLEVAERMHGRRNDEIVNAFFGEGLSPDDVFRHGAAKEALFREKMRPILQKHLVPGVLEFLEKFESIPKAVASNAEPANIDFVLDGAGIRSRFDVIVDGHQVSRAKPFPDIYLRAAELLGVAPRNCIVFEDSPAGIRAGRDAGAQVVGVQTHTAPLPEVDLLIRDFHDVSLEAWLQGRAVRS